MLRGLYGLSGASFSNTSAAVEYPVLVFLPPGSFIFSKRTTPSCLGELMLKAHCSGDQNLIEAYREAEDIHRITASQVFHVPFEEVPAVP